MGTTEEVGGLLEAAKIELAPPASASVEAFCLELVRDPKDALIVAAAIGAGIDFFVTLDKRHLLANETFKDQAPFPVGNPGEALAWYRSLSTDTADE